MEKNNYPLQIGSGWPININKQTKKEDIKLSTNTALLKTALTVNTSTRASWNNVWLTCNLHLHNQTGTSHHFPCKAAHSKFYNSYISALDINSNFFQTEWPTYCQIEFYTLFWAIPGIFWIRWVLISVIVHIWNISSWHSKQNVPIFTALHYDR